MDSTTHSPLIFPPEWLENKSYPYLKKSGRSSGGHVAMNSWLNALKWTDEIVKDIILGFRERGLEDETLFVMYAISHTRQLIVDTEITVFRFSAIGIRQWGTQITMHSAFLCCFTIHASKIRKRKQ
jgi:phosphoglycerol transferase MdoB-like AlkP superfamily enzyme